MNWNRSQRKENRMPRKFNVAISIQGAQVESNPISVTLTPIAPKNENQYPALNSVDVHDAKDVSEKTAPDCWLQIWELDFYKTEQTLVTEETDLNDWENRCLASFQGIVVKSNGTYAFRALGKQEFARTEASPLNGKIKIRLTSGANDPKTEDVIVHLPEYEGMLELAAVLRSSDDRDFAGQKELTPVFVQNIEASIRRQLDERLGIAVAFVTDYKGSNGEFGRQANEMLASLPTFKLVDDTVRMGYHTIGSYTEIAEKLHELFDAISSTYLIPLNEISAANLCLYGHGMPQKLQIEYSPNDPHNYSLPGSLDTVKVHDFVNQIQPFLSDFIVVTINACACARSYSAGPVTGPSRFSDGRFGQPYPCELLGEDSLGLTMYRDLAKLKLLYPCVWAHATAGHATRNPNLRVFCSRGSADLPNLLFGTRSLEVTGDNYRDHFKIPKAGKKNYKKRTHNANLLRRICQQNALFFDWSWLDGNEEGQLPEGASQNYSDEANAVLSEIRRLLPEAVQGDEDQVVYSDDTRRFITGVADGVDDADLSEHFSYSDISGLSTPVFVSVELLRMVQLLKDRTRKVKKLNGLTLLSIAGDGKSLTLQPAPPTSANAVAVAAKAREMLQQGFIASANLQNTILSMGM